MNSEIQDRLIDAIGACLRPLVRMLLRSGISYHQFDEAVKLAFVRESLRQAESPRKRTNVSRIAVRTGMSRKEVARLRDLVESGEEGSATASERRFHSNQAARVLQLWHSNERFMDGAGRPCDLAFDLGNDSFVALVKLVGGDVPAGAVRAELLSAGAIEELSDGRLHALKRHFIPGDLGEEMVVGFKQIVAPLLTGLAHNAEVPKQDAFVQRVAYSDSLSREALPQFRQLAGKRAEDFVQSVDDWLGGNESAHADGASQRGQRVGVGVFYFEQSDEPKK